MCHGIVASLLMWTMVLLMGFGMAIDPARLGLALVMLSRRRPMVNLFAFWVGGMLAGIGIGLAVLVVMRDLALMVIHSATSMANELRESVVILSGGRLQITIGIIMLLLAARSVARTRARAGIPASISDGGLSTMTLERPPTSLFARLGSRTQEMLDCDVVWPAFVVGVASSAPPAESLIALTFIMASGAAIGTQFSAFIVFTLLVLAVIEIPLVGYLAMPQKTEVLMMQFQNWIRSRRQQISLTVLVGVGFLFLFQGVAAL
jgi:Sap, sulfolipid-1-addressing protein